ncbi:MAG: fumarylacetoacetate hydrolase family protein [Gammaproteobacteria bacterium]|nr:fumarylacetoacetate hydrolase family protein [Gammaproteobacteria bacterium]
MRVTKNFVRYRDTHTIHCGLLNDDIIAELSSELFDPQHTFSGRQLKLADVQLLAPCQPSKVIAVGLNYRSHIGNMQTPEYPGLFAKYPTCIIGNNAAIIMPDDAESLHYEGELVVVIGKEAKNITPAQAKDFIFGVTAGNDVSERHWQRNDMQWFRAKGSDTFGPIGPVITQGLNYNQLNLTTRLNGEIKQHANTSELIFDVDYLVSYISRYVTLVPGDVIFTGTPGRTSRMAIDDVVEVELEGVGTLRNSIERVALHVY